MPFIIRAKINANDTSGMFARDWFDCQINDASECYETMERAMRIAKDAYKGKDCDGIGCSYWVEETNEP